MSHDEPADAPVFNDNRRARGFFGFYFNLIRGGADVL
jgi:hypothetical protein